MRSPRPYLKARKALLVLPLILGACASPEQIAAQRAFDAEQRQAAEQQYINALASRCSSFGVPDGSPEMRQCMLQLHQSSEANRTALGAAVIGSGMLNPRPVQIYRPIQPYQVPTR
jgi:hypothetical protein